MRGGGGERTQKPVDISQLVLETSLKERQFII